MHVCVCVFVEIKNRKKGEKNLQKLFKDNHIIETFISKLKFMLAIKNS